MKWIKGAANERLNLKGQRKEEERERESNKVKAGKEAGILLIAPLLLLLRIHSYSERRRRRRREILSVWKREQTSPNQRKVERKTPTKLDATIFPQFNLFHLITSSYNTVPFPSLPFSLRSYSPFNRQ